MRQPYLQRDYISIMIMSESYELLNRVKYHRGINDYIKYIVTVSGDTGRRNCPIGSGVASQAVLGYIELDRCFGSTRGHPLPDV